MGRAARLAGSRFSPELAWRPAGWVQDMRQPAKNIDFERFAQPVVLRRPAAEPAPHSMTAKAMSELRADILAVRLQPDAELPLKLSLIHI